MATTRSTSKIAPKWVRQTRKYFLKFLRSTGFPPVERHGDRGQTFMYPEWLIMLIGVLAVKCKEPTDLCIPPDALPILERVMGAHGAVTADFRKPVARTIKKHRLPAWNNSRICGSNLSSRIPRVTSSVAIR